MELIAGHPWQMWATLAAISVIITLYATERAPMDMVSVGTIAFFLVFFHLFPIESADAAESLTPAKLLMGFSSTALVAVMALLVVGQGIFHTGALDGPTQQLLNLFDRHPIATTTLTAFMVFGISAFLNNTPVVVIFIPIVAAIAAKGGAPASKVMIPLSYLSILAGQTTLIGSSTNLLIAESVRRTATRGEIEGLAPLGFFDMTPMGLVLAGVGLVYVVAVLPRLLPVRRGDADDAPASGKQFIAQIDVQPGHPLIGQKPTSGMLPGLEGVTIRLIQRRERAYLPPFERLELRAGDSLVIAATRKRLTELLKSDPALLGGLVGATDATTSKEFDVLRDLCLAEAVVAPGSRMIGRTVGQIGFRYQTRCLVLGIQRRSRMIRARMGEIRLEAGDVLLVLGTRQDVTALRRNRDVLILDWSTSELPDKRMAGHARLIFAAVIAAAATGLLPIVVASFVGAIAMVAFGCLNMRQALRAFDERIFFLVGAALAMGAVLEATGGAAFLANLLLSATSGAPPLALVSAFFLLVAIMTNLLSNNATAVLFTPIALSAAARLGVDPEPLVFAVLFGANCSFATPIGYKTNLLVMTPGHYRFGDFVRAGLPLIVLMWVAFSVTAAWWYDLSP